MHSDLIDMKNLGKTSVLWLNAVGIRNRQMLEQLGSVAAYQKVKTRGFKVSKVLLYSLEGALTNQNWNQLDTEYKQRLVDQAEADGHVVLRQ
jgi:DNA transformation protein